VQKRVVETSRGEGGLIIDNTGFGKQGKTLGGVARQYAGTLGKVGTCQIAVIC
jgi:SRSO17 transposase